MQKIGTIIFVCILGVLVGTGFCLAEENSDFYVSPKITSAPVIDGLLDDKVWDNAIKISDWHVVTSEDNENYSGPRALVAHDDMWLYVAFDIPHSNPEMIKPYFTRHDERIQSENCVKLSFAAGEKGKEYYLFRLSAGNVRAEQKLYDPSWDIPWRSATKITKNGWSAEMALPLCKLTSAKSLSTARMNFIISMLVPEKDQDKNAYEGFGLEALKRIVIAWGATVRTSNYMPDKIFDFANIKIQKPFLPYLKSVELGKYNTDGDLITYTVSADLQELGGVNGTVKLVGVDRLADDSNKKETSLPIILEKKEKVIADLQIPIAGIGKREVEVLLKNPVTGEVLQTYREDVADKIDLFSAYSERNYYTSEENAIAVCQIRLNKEGFKGKQLNVFSKDGKNIASESFLSQETDVKIPLKKLNMGNNSLKIVLQENSGKALAEQHIVMVIKEPNPGHEVKIDHKACIVLNNGKPFFPFGFYVMGTQKEDFVEMAEGGMNTVLKLGWTQPVQKLQKLLDVLQETGLYLITPAIIGSINATGQCDILTEVKAELFQKHYQSNGGLNYIQRSQVFKKAFDKESSGIFKAIEQVKNHPAILAWYTFDEPVSKRVFSMYKQGRELYRKIYEIDGYRPVYQMGMTSVKTGPEDSDWADILGHDPYWVPKHPYAAKIDYTASLTRKVRAAADEDRKPTWMVLTGERWSATYKRFLSPAENRCQAYLAIISGARGLLYYYYPIQFQANWEMFCQLASEIKQLSPSILSKDIPQTIISIQNGKEVKYGDVLAKLFPRSDGHGYVLIAANKARYPVDVKFCMKNVGKNFSITNMFEPKNIPNINEVKYDFTDRFEALGVRVYTLSGIISDPTKLVMEIKTHQELKDKEPDAYVIARGKPGKNRIPNASFEDETNPGFPDYYVIPWFKKPRVERIGLSGCPFVLDLQNPWHGEKSLRLRNGNDYVYPLKFMIKELNPCVFSLYMRADRDGVKVIFNRNGKKNGEPIILTTKWKRYSFILPDGAGNMELLPEKNSTIWFDALQVEVGAEMTEFEL